MRTVALLTLRQIGYCLLTGTALALALPASSSTSDPMTEAVEVLMDRQGVDLDFLGRYIGADSAATLNFTSNVDPVTKSFHYSLLPGTLYRSQSLAITGSGAYNTSLDRWDLTGTISYNGKNWTPTGTTKITGDPEFSSFFDIFVDIDPPKNIPDTETSVSYEQTAARTVSVGTITQTEHDLLGNRRVISMYNTYDSYMLQGPKAGTWVWDSSNSNDQSDNFQLHSDGFNAYPGGGIGMFTARVVAVPEPTSIMYLIAVSAIGLLRKRRRR